MILEDATFEAFGYELFELTLQSNNPIIAACELCGEFRVTTKNYYYTFCKSCSTILGGKHKGKKLTEEHKAKLSATAKGETHPHKGVLCSEKTKVKISAAMKGENNPMFGTHRTGKKSPHWLGGISFEPYCIKFNDEYKDYIRNLLGNECFLCGKSEVDNRRKLSVHHVNYNKDCGCDETKCICVPLCINCHTKTNSDRDFWQALIVEMLKPIEAWIY